MAWYQIGTTNGVPQWRRDNPDGTYEVRVQENAPSVDAPVRGFDPESFYEEGRGERKAEIQARIKQAVEAKTKREVSPEERAEVAFELMKSLDAVPEQGCDEAWGHELRGRLEAFREGRLVPVPFTSALDRAREQIARRG